MKPNFDTGIDWSTLVKDDGKTKFNMSTILDNNNTATSFGQIGVGTINASDFAIKIKALQQVSDTKILSSP